MVCGMPAPSDAVAISLFPNTKTLSPEFNVSWAISGDRIHFEFQVLSQGWVGFGLAEPTSGSMPGSDMVVLERNGDQVEVNIWRLRW